MPYLDPQPGPSSAAAPRRAVLPARWGMVLVLLGLVLGAIAMSGVGGTPALLLAPAAASVLVSAMFFSVLLARSPEFPLDEIGTVYGGALMFYTVMPLLNFAITGVEWTPLKDNRLAWMQPSAQEVARIGWYCVLFSTAFAVAYLAVRRGAAGQRGVRTRVTGTTFAAALTLWVVAVGGIALVGLFYDLRAGSYLETYLVVQRLPLGVRQFLRLFGGLRLFVGLVLLLWIFSDFRRRRWLAVIWVLVAGVQTLLGPGERTALVLLMLACLIYYHRLVKPVRVWTAVAAMLTVVVLFTALGLYRGYKQAVQRGSSYETGYHAGESEAVFVNALDMQRRVEAGDLPALPKSLYISDIISFVPSQLLPFTKLDLSEWYVTEFYPEYRAQGGGLAFGVIPQSLLGWGWSELLLRGLLVGALFGWLHRVYVRNAHRMWYVVVYLWLLLLAYHSFRTSTFFLISAFVQQVIPAIAIVEGIRFVLRRAVPRYGTGLQPASGWSA